MSANVQYLSNNWAWKQRSASNAVLPLDELALPDLTGGTENSFVDGWLPAQTFPSEVHVELLKAGRIEDSYIGFNEHKAACIPPNGHTHALLEFEGLDTVCDVYLNGTKILATSNQLRTYFYTLDLTNQDVSQSDGIPVLQEKNSLLLHFYSAKAYAKAEEAKYGKVRAGSVNLGDPSRVYLRKAQYDWRWDWGPELLTCGPYRPITFTTYSTRLVDIHTRAHVALTDSRAGESLTPTFNASLRLDITFAGSLEHAMQVKVILRDGDGREFRSEMVELSGSAIQVGGEEGLGKENQYECKDVLHWVLGEEVELWWPVGYGKQVLYEVEVALLDQNAQILSTFSKRIGFRTVELVQAPLAEEDQHGKGTTFMFVVNAVRIFIGGSNWIPASSLLTTLKPTHYKKWLELLRDGGQNMVRLWGGGVYEPNEFYDACDALGILVWQDFQFACGVYPAHEEFLATVKVEAEQNVRRLRHHPALTLFCGNNEDYQQVLQWGDVPTLPALEIYESLLPAVVSALSDPEIPYHRGSPYGGKGWDTADPTIGDIHQWNVWAGKELPWQEYGRLGGRFVSEFGIPSFPSMRTVSSWMDDAPKKEWHAQSKLMAQHTRAGSFERRFAIVMNENFRLTADLETHVYNTQIMQSEAVSLAYRVWRREWRGKGKEYTSGVVVWQLNDCWPVVSWAIADYFMRAKPVYYTIARELAPVIIGISRIVQKNRDNDRPKQLYEFGAFQTVSATLEIWSTSASLQPISATLRLRFYDLNSSWTHTTFRAVQLLPNQSTELLSFPCPAPEKTGLEHPSCTVVANATLIDDDMGKVLARYTDWPQPYKFLEFPDPGLKVELHVGEEGDKLVITVERPVKGLFFSIAESDGEEPKWSDNALDVVPNDTQTVMVRGLNGRKVFAAYLGKELAFIVA
ncbi:glycoside hydrolase [Crucibulum laeve]|uniref:Beta-mannosidase B n=1 Tax=Crucibulum laeve TaxID=68775 RepID=A0A5C3M2F5_9AGAR|nr:glycoside hydrolase [Crucibulum laeve]